MFYFYHFMYTNRGYQIMLNSIIPNGNLDQKIEIILKRITYKITGIVFGRPMCHDLSLRSQDNILRCFVGPGLMV